MHFQSPKKVNLVAALVRGMRVEDALLQLQVTVKRAAKTVYQVTQALYTCQHYQLRVIAASFINLYFFFFLGGGVKIWEYGSEYQESGYQTAFWSELVLL